ncbi:tetratricopeptide repeat protein [Geothrix sp. 21YS21S-2]|uniref:tetratricopeptide repeat protein n=1 Tax=Geothrix sp. 21YS21S-2 TaxID=3068893 RepID=UPI0027B88BD5|nr:tetratricopeptide repeat protein [Geothrix sp. 21YS21S-2]
MQMRVRSLFLPCLPFCLLVAGPVTPSSRQNGAGPIPLTRVTGGAPAPSLAFLTCLGAAERGDTEAQARVASMFFLGEGVPADVREAVAWYLRAAAGGDAKSMMILGMMHEDGDGVSRDPDQALRYFVMAAQRGDLDAQVKLGVKYYLGEGVPRDLQEARTWLQRAAVQGDAYAQGCLGLMYAVGEGVPRDPTEAYAWLTRAEAGGNRQVAQPLETLKRDLTPDQLEQGRRRAEALGAGRPAETVAR